MKNKIDYLKKSPVTGEELIFLLLENVRELMDGQWYKHIQMWLQIWSHNKRMEEGRWKDVSGPDLIVTPPTILQVDRNWRGLAPAAVRSALCSSVLELQARL